MRAMDAVAGRFARSARRTLPFLVRQRARLVPQPVSLCAAGSVSGCRAGVRFEARLEAEDGPAWAAIVLNAEALALLLESALGRGSADGAARLGAELTLAQSALIARIVRSLAADYAAAVRAEASLVLRVGEMRAVRAHEPGDTSNVDGLMVDCTFGELCPEAAITILISAEALESAAREQAEEELPDAADPRIAEAVRDVPVEVVAELGRVVLGLRQVLELKVGQVLRLPAATDDPVLVRVGGVRKFDATPVISRGQLSVQIRGRHEE
jgi:flagellar motor switch protein FliM